MRLLHLRNTNLDKLFLVQIKGPRQGAEKCPETPKFTTVVLAGLFCALFSFFILGLIISQGNAWTQVVASRISGSIYETMKENKIQIDNSEYVLKETIKQEKKKINFFYK